jgi:hypothetical protein
VLNLWGFSGGYLRPFQEAGGGLSTFQMGARLRETSNHFVRTDRLYAQLRAQGIRRVYGNFFITMPLRVYDQQHALEIDTWRRSDPLGDASVVNTPTALLFYDDPAAEDVPWDPRHLGQIRRGPALYQRHAAYPPLFRVYVAQPPAPIDAGP